MAGGNVDILFQSTLQETQSTGTAAGLRVSVNGGVSTTYTDYFRPDTGGGPAPLDFRLFADTAQAVAIDGAFTFREIRGVNIRLEGAYPAADDPRIDLTAWTDHSDSGQIDVLLNGDITLTEIAGDLRIGTIQSNAGDVALTAAGPLASMYDINAAEGTTAWVIGNRIRLEAPDGALGSATNFIEIDSSHQFDNVVEDAVAGLVDGLAARSVFLKEMAGDLQVGGIVATGIVDGVVISAEAVVLITVDGSILNGRDAGDWTANVQAANIDLIAHGGSIGAEESELDLNPDDGDPADGGLQDNDLRIYGAGIPPNDQNTMEIHPAIPLPGRLLARADNDIFLAEVSGAVNVLQVASAGGQVRLKTYDSARRHEDINLLATGGTSITGEVVVASAHVTAAGHVALLAGDDIWLPLTALVRSDTSVLIKGDAQDPDGDPAVGTFILIDGDVQAPLVEIEGGDDLDHIQLSHPGGINAGGTTFVRGLVSDDRFYIQAVAGATTLEGGPGADRFFVASNASRLLFPNDDLLEDPDPLAPLSALTGTLENLGNVFIDTGTGGEGGTRDAIYLSADASPAALTGAVQFEPAGSPSGCEGLCLSGLGLAGGSIRFAADQGTALVLELSPFDDTFRVTSWADNMVLYVAGGDGNDTFNMGSAGDSLSDIRGIVAFAGQGGTDTLNVYGDASAAPGQLTAIGVTGMGMGRNQLLSVHNAVFGAGYNLDDPDYPAAIYYATRKVLDGVETISSTVEDVHLWLGGGDDIFYVDSTYGYGTTRIHGNDGEDAITVGSTATGLHPNSLRRVDFVAGPLILYGDDGLDSLIVDDSGDDNPNVGMYQGDHGQRPRYGRFDYLWRGR